MTTRSETTSTTIWVAIDIAKHHHAVLIETSDGKHQRFRMASTSKDQQRLADLAEDFPSPARVATEPIGDYHFHAGLSAAFSWRGGVFGVFRRWSPLLGSHVQLLGQKRP